MNHNNAEPTNKLSSDQAQNIADILAANGLTELLTKIEKRAPEINISSYTEEWLSKFITADKEMLELKKQVRVLAGEDDAVLITGETGTGKEILAKALHGRRKGKFIPINCAGLPDQLIESELFGHEKGAFTGALERKIGLFSAAENGTLFLDEIGELSLPLQAKLLRAIQEREIRRVGSNNYETINCRFVAATHESLPDRVREKKFREDLYFRINTFVLKTSPIRERNCDIPLIIKSLDSEGKFPIQELMRNESLDILTLGNVRAIQQIVRRYLVFGR